MKPILSYFYTLDNKFFDDFPDSNLKSNKNQKRPFYYCLKDDNGLYWMIPCTSQIEKYDALIARALSQGKPTDKWHKIKMSGKDNILLIQDIFPVTEKYITKAFMRNKVHQKIASDKEQKLILIKANKIIALSKYKGKLFSTQADIVKIERELLKTLGR